MRIRVGHSPDADDAFMFYGLVKGAVKLGGYEFVEVVEDIESLNKKALKAELEVTALSAHTYALVSDKYYVLSCGSSMGRGYGPIVVAKNSMTHEELTRKTIAIPGKLTTAYLLLRMALGEVDVLEMRFDRIMDAVAQGNVDAGLLIHEGQLTYRSKNLLKVFDLGPWWDRESKGLPLPLGLDAARRDLGADFARTFNQALKDSIMVGMKDKDDAVKYASGFARGMPIDLVDKFVMMYVNDLTLDMGVEGRKALDFLYKRAVSTGVVDHVDLQVV
jgi:1,4-dihydroxy-6-naphthoate synthase